MSPCGSKLTPFEWWIPLECLTFIRLSLFFFCRFSFLFYLQHIHHDVKFYSLSKMTSQHMYYLLMLNFLSSITLLRKCSSTKYEIWFCMGKQILLMKLSILTDSANFNKTKKKCEKLNRIKQKNGIITRFSNGSSVFFFFLRLQLFSLSKTLFSLTHNKMLETHSLNMCTNCTYRCRDQNVNNGYA